MSLNCCTPNHNSTTNQIPFPLSRFQTFDDHMLLSNSLPTRFNLPYSDFLGSLTKSRNVTQIMTRMYPLIFIYGIVRLPNLHQSIALEILCDLSTNTIGLRLPVPDILRVQIWHLEIWIHAKRETPPPLPKAENRAVGYISSSALRHSVIIGQNFDGRSASECVTFG